MAVEQKVVLEDGDGRDARPPGARHLLRQPNYLANFRRLGFDDGDFADGGSDRQVDALVT
jgi:hypothetical protein